MLGEGPVLCEWEIVADVERDTVGCLMLWAVKDCLPRRDMAVTDVAGKLDASQDGM